MVISPMQVISVVSLLLSFACCLLTRRLADRLQAMAVLRACFFIRIPSPSSVVPKRRRSPRPTSIDGFRLGDRATKSIAASRQIPSHHNQGSKKDARIFSVSAGRESCWTWAADLASIPYVISQPDNTSYHLFHTSLLPLHRSGGCCHGCM